MDLFRRSVALYGRFSPGGRERLNREISERRGLVARDLTRRSDVLVIGSLATALIDSGGLPARLRQARERAVPVFGERSFEAALGNETADDATLPLSTVLAQTGLTESDAVLLAAFDLVVIRGDKCRFADAAVMRTAAEMLHQHHSRGDVVRILQQARDKAPTGRRKVVLGPFAKGALQWEGGLTTLEGQGYLPLENAHPDIDELFEAAELSEAAGNREDAARLYAICATADRGDPIALYNLGNVRLAQGENKEALLAYERALARDKGFVEARYNLALALEAGGKQKRALDELKRALAADPAYSDAMFNLAQLLMKSGDIAAAKPLYERYLASNPPAEWAATARKAITYCTARLAG
jgi:tetratricopeptide (TPR) repeat protein